MAEAFVIISIRSSGGNFELLTGHFSVGFLSPVGMKSE